MTYYEKVKTKKPYVPFDAKYSLYGYTDDSPTDDFLGNKSSNIADKIMGLYQELYKRKEINTQILSEVQEDFLEASSELYNHKYTSFLDSKQKSSLEKRVDLLEKTKWSEVVEYWRDSFKIKTYLLNTIQEYKELSNKKKLLE